VVGSCETYDAFGESKKTFREVFTVIPNLIDDPLRNSKESDSGLPPVRPIVEEIVVYAVFPPSIFKRTMDLTYFHSQSVPLWALPVDDEISKDDTPCDTKRKSDITAYFRYLPYCHGRQDRLFGFVHPR
jgi:hypothetical protein